MTCALRDYPNEDAPTASDVVSQLRVRRRALVVAGTGYGAAMEAVDPRLSAALATQLEHRDSTLASGARHVGWKLGMGDAERIGGFPAVGHLTSATELEPGGSFEVKHDAAPHADVELAVEIGVDGRIAACAPCLELVDLGSANQDPAEIVRANIFHRAFALGSFSQRPPPAAASLIVDGRGRAAAPVDDVAERVAGAGRVLASVGERLRPATA
jgi:hypothetical protein